MVAQLIYHSTCTIDVETSYCEWPLKEALWYLGAVYIHPVTLKITICICINLYYSTVHCIYVNILLLIFFFKCLHHKIAPTTTIIISTRITRITRITIMIIVVRFVRSESLLCCLLVVLVVVGVGTITSKMICHSNNTAMKFVYLICS